MTTLRALRKSLGLGAAIAAGTLIVSSVAMATPGNGNANGGSGGSPGNPHAVGTKGNPHAPGAKGNPHAGDPPYGVANGTSKSASSGGGGSAVSPAHPGDENGAPSAEHSDNGHPGKTTICHSTNSTTNPFVEITVANPSLRMGHGRHHDGDDIIPAPPGGCDASNPAVQQALESRAAVSGVLSAERSGDSPAADSPTGDSPASGSVADTPASAHASGSLPFTGLALGVLLSIGVVLLFCGWLVRSLAFSRRP
jgi:hypothetical protein